MLVNGAAIRFRNRCRVELVSKARFLFGKQILEDHAGASLPEQLYCAIQTLYVGQPSEALEARSHVEALLEKVGPDSLAGVPADHIRSMVDEGELYAVLKLLRILIRPVDIGNSVPGQSV